MKCIPLLAQILTQWCSFDLKKALDVDPDWSLILYPVQTKTGSNPRNTTRLEINKVYPQHFTSYIKVNKFDILIFNYTFCQ